MELVRRVRKRATRLFDDVAEDQSIESLSHDNSYYVGASLSFRAWRSRSRCYISIGILVFILTIWTIGYISKHGSDPELEFIVTTAYLTEPLDHSSWFPSRALTDDELSSARVTYSHQRTLNLSSVIAVHQRLLSSDDPPLKCMAPVLYGENVQILSVRGTNNIHMFNPRLMTKEDASAHFIGNAPNLYARFHIALSSMSIDESETENVPIEPFPLFSNMYRQTQSEKMRSIFTVKQKKYIYVNATTWPTMTPHVFEFSIADGGGCVQSMLSWFCDGQRSPIFRNYYTTSTGSDTRS